MTRISEGPLTYLELYSKCKASINISWKQPTSHPWYLTQCFGASISFKGDRRGQTTFARLCTGHLKSLTFSHGVKTFSTCTKCNDADATLQHLLDCVALNQFSVQYHLQSSSLQYPHTSAFGAATAGNSSGTRFLPVARQLGRSDCVVRRCWDQCIREMSFTRRPGSRLSRQTSRLEDRNIVRNALVQPTASSAAIQEQVAPSLGAPVSSQTIRRPIDASVFKWFRAVGNWTAAEWNQVVFRDESRFNFSSDDNRVRVWRPRGERLNPAFALQRHTAPTAGVMVWGVIAYNTRSPLVLFRGTMTTQRYVNDILQTLMQRLPIAIFQQDNARPHTAKVS
ncbi:transposable element Tcb2 transposase [Trichonephila clavipes]|nr:transposable element Tcb2 transposase [Trichonephila clavipes]